MLYNILHNLKNLSMSVELSIWRNVQQIIQGWPKKFAFKNEVYNSTPGDPCIVYDWFCIAVAEYGWNTIPTAWIDYLAQYIKWQLTLQVTYILHLGTLTYTLWVLNSYLLTTSRIKVNYVDSNVLSSSVL